MRPVTGKSKAEFKQDTAIYLATQAFPVPTGRRSLVVRLGTLLLRPGPGDLSPAPLPAEPPCAGDTAEGSCCRAPCVQTTTWDTQHGFRLAGDHKRELMVHPSPGRDNDVKETRPEIRQNDVLRGPACGPKLSGCWLGHDNVNVQIQ